MSEHKCYHFKSDLRRPFVEDFILNEKYKIAGKTAKYLRDFQLDGIRFMFDHFKQNQSCILNDEVGLGKTASVSVFLDCVLPSNGSKKCLIITKNEERLVNWQFHLDVLTNLKWKVAFSKYDVGPETVYLSKWDSLQKSITLAFCDFDCIVLDVRDGLLSNKICCAHLLRYYEKKISLVVSNNDVSMELEEFHSILRLCDRLDSRYTKITAFEEMFSLPKIDTKRDSNLLEEYFQKREKLINFCREFRLRRYRHQFEEYLPLTHLEEHYKSISTWKQKHQSLFDSFLRKSSVTLSIVNKISKEEMMQNLNSEKSDCISDMDEDLILTGSRETNMSPLVFEESGTDGEGIETEVVHLIPEKKTNKNHETNIQVLEKNQNYPNIQRKNNKNDKSCLKTKRTGRLSPINKRQLSNKNRTGTSSERSLRSNHATRSKSQKSKYLIANIEENMNKLNSKRKGKKQKPQLNPNLHSSKMCAKDLQSKNELAENNRNESKLKKIPIVRIAKNLNKSLRQSERFSKIEERGKNVRLSTSQDMSTPPQTPIIISSSSCDEISPNKVINDNFVSGEIQTSPDMFCISEESDLPCAQKNFNSEFRTDGSGISSLLDILDAGKTYLEGFLSSNSSIISLNGSSSNESPGKEVREADPQQCSAQATYSGDVSVAQTNKITKYLHNNSTQQRINEITPRHSITTVEKKIIRTSSSKKSFHNSTQNRSMSKYLKDWLSGSSLNNTQSTRRRLDLW